MTMYHSFSFTIQHSWLLEKAFFHFFSFVFLFFFRWACSKFHDSFTVIFAQDSSILY